MPFRASLAYNSQMQQRPSSRLILLDPEQRVLLFRFEHKSEALAGQSFWATPGGGVDPGETYEEAARRELFEEVGIALADPGPQIARRTAVFALTTGEMVEADERYFLVRVADGAVSDSNWTALEREVMTAHHWWSHAELRATTEQVWPEELPDMLIDAGIWEPLSAPL